MSDARPTLNRRDFLAAAGATALAGFAAAQEAPAMPEPRFKKALKYGMIAGNTPPERKLTIARDVGFDGVEVGVNDPVVPGDLRAASEKVGLPVHGVVNGSIENIPAAVDLALDYGATSVLLVAGRVDEDTPYAENYARTQAVIREAIPYAEDKGILLLVENVWNNFLLSPLEMARYIDELESDMVGVYFDVGNVVRFGYPEHWIPVLGERIKKLDVKEYSREKQMHEGLWKGFDVAIGDGSIDWAAVRRQLAAIGYSGWATAEVPGGDAAALEDIADRMNRVLGVGE